MKKTNKLFRILIMVYIVSYALLCIYGALVPNAGNSYDRGASIYSPAKSSTVGKTFTVSGSVYSKQEILQANIVLKNEEGIIKVPLFRDTIIYEDKVLEKLSTFDEEICMENGQYNLSIEINESNGKSHTFAFYDIEVDNNFIASPFETFKATHLIIMAAIALVFIIIFVLFKNKKQSHIIFVYVCSLIIIVSDIYSRIWLISNGTFRASYDLAFHLCDISCVLIPIFLFMNIGKAKDNLFNILFIWGMGGAFMAILAPQMNGYVFPSFYFFYYFIKHAMIIFGVLLAIIFYGMRPNIKRLGWLMIVSTLTMVATYGINQLVRFIPPFEAGNYMFFSYPPPDGSLVDIIVEILGPSPYYLLGMLLLVPVIYIIFWLPFYIASKFNTKI